MKRFVLRALPAFAAALLVAACGGGHDPAPVEPVVTQMSGTAAVGAPVAGGIVSIRCASQAVVTTSTAADGRWSASLVDAAFPCQASVTGGSLPPGLQLDGFALNAAVAGNVNITPLTTLIFAQMMNQVQQVFANITAQIQAFSQNFILQQFLDAGFAPPPNPLYGPFLPAFGDVHDDLIEAFMLSLQQQGTTLGQVAQEIAEHGAPQSGEIIPPSVVAFSTIPADFPPNMPSWGFEATGLTSLGDRVVLAADTPRKLRSLTVGMSSWACESGAWHTEDCVSAAGARFTHAITLKIYNEQGQVLATKTQEFAMPYRPSSDPSCELGRWRAADGACYNGFAFQVTFDLQSLGVTVPDSIRWEVSYNTRSHGPQPLGVAGPYDSLNVGTYDPGVASPSAGTDPDPGFVIWNGEATNEEHLGLMATVRTGP